MIAFCHYAFATTCSTHQDCFGGSIYRLNDDLNRPSLTWNSGSLSSFRAATDFGWSYSGRGLERGGIRRCRLSDDTNEILRDVLMVGTRTQDLLGAGEDQRERSCIDDRLPSSEQHIYPASHDVFLAREGLRH